MSNVMGVLDFEVRRKVVEALGTGRYVVTISTVNEETKKLDHYAVFKEFPTDDIFPSLEENVKLVAKQLGKMDEEGHITP